MADPPPEPVASKPTFPGTEAETGDTLPVPAEHGAEAAAPREGSRATLRERPGAIPLREATTADLSPAGELPAAGEREGQSLAGRYTLLERIGRGGMSEVYLARHELLKKTVAVKVLRPEIAVTKASLNRFHQEAVAAATIGSPHIIDITDYGFTDDGNAFIVMERLVGADLRTVLSHFGALPSGRAVGIIRQVLRGLAAAHARGIVHRDLKAENVFLCERDEGGEFVKLLDFGISKVTQPLDGSAELGIVRTSTGAVMGTPQYIAPEQAHGDRDIDHRVDIYSAGVMLYEMLAGELPFSGRSALDVVMKHVQELPQPPRERRPDLQIPPQLDAVVLRAMSKDRDERYADAQAMIDALPEPAELPGGFESVMLPAPPLRRRRRSWGYWGYGVVVAAVFAAGTAGVLVLFPGGAVWDRFGATPVILADAQLADAVAGTASAPPDAAPQGSAVDAAEDRATVTLEVVAHPEGARIYRGDELVGRGRWRERVPRGSASLVLTVRADGHRSQRVVLEPAGDQSLVVRLVRGAAEGPTGAGTEPADLHANPYVKRELPRAPRAPDGGALQP